MWKHTRLGARGVAHRRAVRGQPRYAQAHPGRSTQLQQASRSSIDRALASLTILAIRYRVGGRPRVNGSNTLAGRYARSSAGTAAAPQPRHQPTAAAVITSTSTITTLKPPTPCNDSDARGLGQTTDGNAKLSRISRPTQVGFLVGHVRHVTPPSCEVPCGVGRGAAADEGRRAGSLRAGSTPPRPGCRSAQ
jgi:hypothetical protein